MPDISKGDEMIDALVNATDKMAAIGMSGN
jgi:hypothetical protein